MSRLEKYLIGMICAFGFCGLTACETPTETSGERGEDYPENVDADDAIWSLHEEGMDVVDDGLSVVRVDEDFLKPMEPMSIEVKDRDPALNEDESKLAGQEQARGYYLKSAVWNRYAVPVCWETSGSSTEKGWVRNAVEASWESSSSMDLTGWGTCTSSSPSGIRIKISDEGPHTKGLGDRLDGKTSGMVLNFTFNNWSKSCGTNATARERCIRTIAIHEFGHALGIAHEHNRPDSWKSCKDDPQGTNGDTLVGQFDPNSIMNYCYDSSYSGVLSAGDKTTINVMYPKSRENDIGVIQDANTACPGDRIVIRMDTEDNNNKNSSSGWIGEFNINSNAMMTFCRVDGASFKNLGSSASNATNYLVLKLGDHCPNGSVDVARRFDNEDDDTNNWSIGDIRPSTQDGNTWMRFCAFLGSSYSSYRTTSLPYLGFSYGVFAAPGFTKGSSYGYVRTDDEDDDNNNQWVGSTAANSIIEVGSNTKMHMWRR